MEMIEELRGHVVRYLLGFRAALHEHTHSELVNHIESGDFTAAESWLRAHLEMVRAKIADLAREADEGGDEEPKADSSPFDVLAWKAGPDLRDARLLSRLISSAGPRCPRRACAR